MKQYLVIGLIILFFALALGILKPAFMLSGFSQLYCDDAGTNLLTCSAGGGSSAGCSADKCGFSIYKPSAVSSRHALMLSKTIYLKGHTDCTMPTYMNNYNTCISDEFVATISQPNQARGTGQPLVILDGSYKSKTGETRQFKTYGFCDDGYFAGCWVYLPEELKADQENPLFADLPLSASQTRIYIKLGGYDKTFKNPTTPEEIEVNALLYPIVQEPEVIPPTEEPTTEEPTPSEEPTQPAGSSTTSFNLIQWVTDLFNKFWNWFKT